jgi:hypothetical protein
VLDRQDFSSPLANWPAPCFHLDAERRVQILLECGALALLVTVFIRSGASAYLHVEVVHGRGRARRREQRGLRATPGESCRCY